MTVTELLDQSRNAHANGRLLVRRGLSLAARSEFQAALDLRLQARALDPGHADPAWAGDLRSLHSRKELDRDLARVLLKAEGETDPQGYDQPSQKARGELLQMDTDLERYYRQQLGEDPNPRSRVDVVDAAAVVHVPDQWRLRTAGEPPCAQCQHPPGVHVKDGCSQASFGLTAVEICPCTGYVPSVCDHRWKTGISTRECGLCHEVDELQAVMALEDTMAFKQLQKEADARQAVAVPAAVPVEDVKPIEDIHSLPGEVVPPVDPLDVPPDAPVEAPADNSVISNEKPDGPAGT